MKPARLVALFLALAIPLSSSCKRKETDPKAANLEQEAPGQETTTDPGPALIDAAPTPIDAAPAPIDAKQAEARAAEVKPAIGFHYFATAGGNHPTLFYDRASSKFFVVGRTRALGGSTELTESATSVEDALAAYFKRLVQLGYEPQGAPKKKDPAPGSVVEVPLGDLLGTGPKESAGLAPAQAKALYQMRPSDAWEIFSGLRHPTNDAPAMTAHGGGLMVFDASGKHEFAWARSRDAFAKFVELSKRPPRPTTAPSSPPSP